MLNCTRRVGQENPLQESNSRVHSRPLSYTEGINFGDHIPKIHRNSSFQSPYHRCKAVKTLIVGCGYLGRRVAGRCRAEGHVVSATTRDAASHPEWEAQGITAIEWDVTEQPRSGIFSAPEVVVYAVGYQRGQAYSRDQVHRDGIERLFANLPNPPRLFIYVSSTGVYGEDQENLVDEGTPAAPDSDSGQAILRAEDFLRSHPWSDRVIILRLAGIYGPDRVPVQGPDPATDADPWINLIHVDDAANAIVELMRGARPPKTYVLADGMPVRRSEFKKKALEIVGVSAPKNSARPPRIGRGKRINPNLIHRDLGFQCRYPTYIAGLQAIAAAMGDPRR